jgi:hypothetical protein
LAFWAQGSGFRVQYVGLRDQGLEFRVKGFRVQGFGLRVYDLRFWVKGLVFRI